MDKTIGQRIQDRRLELGLSISQLQQITGISKGNLSSYEYSRFLPNCNNLIALSKGLSCSIDWLLTGNGTTLVPDECFENKTDEYISLFRYFNALDAQDRGELLCLAKMKYEKVSKKETSSLSQDHKASSSA